MNSGFEPVTESLPSSIEIGDCGTSRGGWRFKSDAAFVSVDGVRRSSHCRINNAPSSRPSTPAPKTHEAVGEGVAGSRLAGADGTAGSEGGTGADAEADPASVLGVGDNEADLVSPAVVARNEVAAVSVESGVDPAAPANEAFGAPGASPICDPAGRSPEELAEEWADADDCITVSPLTRRLRSSSRTELISRGTRTT